MKYLIALLLLVSCGYSNRNSEFVGQVKYVEHATPIFCPEYVGAGVTLGVMRNGTGSMSTHDAEVLITSKEIEAVFKEAAGSGALIKSTYDEKRFSICTPMVVVTSAEIMK